MSCLVPEDASLSSIFFTPGLVRKGIKHVKTRSKGGPDCISSIFFQMMFTVVIRPCISIMF
jgi:hypothetical protein